MAMRYPGGLIATSPVNAAYPSGVWTQAQTIPYASQNVWQNDQYWPYTTLLLHGDGTNGAQNNTFQDSSSNNFTITRNGNTTQGAFTPFQQSGYWSNYFDGTGDYLTLASGAAFAFGTGDFTVECFVYINSFPANPGSVYFVDARNSSQTGTWAFLTNNNGTDPTRLDWYTGSTAFTGAALTANTWSHIVYTRSSSTYAIFINGTRVATGTDSTNYNVSPTTSYIAARYSADNALNGYMSNLRVVKGSSVYSPSSSTLTIPTTPLTAITNTQLLTCQSNRFVDNSASPFTLTVYGTPSVQAFQPFPGPTTWSASVLGGSGYFDGSGDYLTVETAAESALNLTGTFTFEFWFYRNATGDMWFFSKGGGVDSWNTTNGIAYQAIIETSTFKWQFSIGGGSLVSIGVTAPAISQWVHVAVGRDGTTTRVWVNGSSIGTSTSTPTPPSTRNIIYAAANQTGGSNANGYMAGLRIVNGTDVYGVSNTSITVPTSPPTNITNTKLLLNMTNAGIFDNAQMNDLETVGNAQVSTSVVKYGTGSMAFDGSGDYLVGRTTDLLSFNTGDFTVEMWVYPNSVAGNIVLIDTRSSGTDSGWAFYINSSSKLALFTSNADRITAGSALSASTWTHVVLARSGSTLAIYMNGVQSATATYSTTMTCPGRISIASGFDNAAPLNGYIDDLRITKGVARYISNFTPPIARMPNQ